MLTEPSTNTFWYGWCAFWQLVTGQYGMYVWLGFVVADLLSTAIYELLKGIVYTAYVGWRS